MESWAVSSTASIGCYILSVAPSVAAEVSYYLQSFYVRPMMRIIPEFCDNQQFQRYNYSECSVFDTKIKGFGIRANQDIPAETFIIEYVGEVLDNKLFEKRAKKYSENKNIHYYFMALKSNAIIDATKKGNISRFINHSCDPNAETQKWTVNGELASGSSAERISSKARRSLSIININVMAKKPKSAIAVLTIVVVGSEKIQWKTKMMKT